MHCARSFETQLSATTEESDVVNARRDLNRSYDTFVSRFGPLSSRDNLRAFADDPDQPLLLSLEERDAQTGRHSKPLYSSSERWIAIGQRKGPKRRRKPCSFP